MTNLIDPNRPGALDAVALAQWLGRMNDDALRGAEEAFRLAADGRPVRLGGVELQFANATQLIPASLAAVIARHRKDGTALLPALEELAADVEAAFRRGDLEEQMEKLWRL